MLYLDIAQRFALGAIIPAAPDVIFKITQRFCAPMMGLKKLQKSAKLRNKYNIVHAFNYYEIVGVNGYNHHFINQ